MNLPVFDIMTDTTLKWDLNNKCYPSPGSMTQDLYKYLTFHARDMMCDLTTSRSSLLETIQDICFGLECKSNAIANNSLNKRRTNNRIDKGAPKCMGFMFELLLSILNQVYYVCNFYGLRVLLLTINPSPLLRHNL